MRKELGENDDLHLLTYQDLLNYKPDPKDEIMGTLGGLIRRGLGTFLQGFQNAGKSVLAFQLAMCVAMGVDFLGMKIKRPCRVLYVTDEGDEFRWKGDITSIEGHMKKDGLRVDRQMLDRNFHVCSPEMATGTDFAIAVERAVKLWKPDLIIVDNYQSFVTGNINDVNTFRQWMNPLNAMARRDKIALLVLMHFTKPKAKDDDPVEENPDLGAYSAGGSATQANWVRHSFELLNPKNPKQDVRYRLRFSKKPETTGLVDLDKQPTRYLYLERSGDRSKPYWRASANQGGGVKADDGMWKSRLIETTKSSHPDWGVGKIINDIKEKTGNVVSRQYVYDVLAKMKDKKKK
jgi:hypothetical protein